MFWNKKKNRGLPDLPAPEIKNSEIDKKEEISSLPSFPDAPSKKGFSQSIIKDAVEPEENSHFPIPKNKKSLTKEISDQEELPEIPGTEKEGKTFKSHLAPEKKFSSREVTEWKPPKTTDSERKIIEKGPVFVKLDKFNEAKDSLDEMKFKLDEIDELLRNLKEVKSKEEKELADWEKEMDELKARLSSLTKNVFENVER
jgi:soluble cytochrome b562